MTFNNLADARKHFRQYKPYDILRDASNLWDLKNAMPDHVKMGSWVLSQIIRDTMRGTNGTGRFQISRPILGLFAGYAPCDQTVEFCFVEKPRAWTNSYKVNYNGYASSVAMYGPEIESVALWGDTIKILGVFDKSPSVSELRKVLTNQL